MTTIVGLSRSMHYALIAKDSMAFEMDPSVPNGRPTPMSSKQQMVRPISSYVLASTGGDLGISDDLYRRLEPRLSPADGFAACLAAARDVIADLVRDDDDLAGRLYRATGLAGEPLVPRMPVLDHFNLELIGFERDGRTQAAVWDGEWHQRERLEGELVFCAPYGVDDHDLTFYDDFYDSEESLSLADAIAFAFGAHRILGAKYPDRLTSDVHVHLLRWRGWGKQPTAAELELDRHDVDSFADAYKQLA